MAICLKMISLQLVFGPSRSVAMTNSFLLVVSTQLTFGDIRQMALAYDKSSGSWVLLDTSGTARRATAGGLTSGFARS